MRFRPCDDCLAYYPDAYGDFDFVLIIVYYFVLLSVHVVSCERVFLDLWCLQCTVHYCELAAFCTVEGGGLSVARWP
jgi:hypothetical protein